MRFLVATSLLVAATTAFADAPARAPAKPAAPTTAPDVRQMHADDCAAARKAGKTCVLDMGNDDIVGAVPDASGIGVAVIVTPKQPSLIRYRRDFIVEILKSAEDL